MLTAWARVATVGWVIGAIIGYSGDYGVNGPGWGALIGLAASPLVILALFLLLFVGGRSAGDADEADGIEDPDAAAEFRRIAKQEAEKALAEERSQQGIEKQRQEAEDRRKRKRRNRARAAIVCSGWLVGYLAGAIYHRAFMYPEVITWAGLFQGFFVTSLVMVRDPSEESPV